MSTLKVEVVRIETLENHPNADRLELAHVKGWQCVVQKGVHKVGDRVLYVPIDSILPKEVEDKIFGPDAKVKPNKGRIRTIKLRGAISQGMVVPLQLFNMDFRPIGTDVTAELGITKYEPPEPNFVGKKTYAPPRKKNPFFHKYTSIENFKNYPNLFQEGEEVVITEKIHGCLQADTKIYLADGTTKTIKEIVDNKLDVEVLGRDDEGKLVPTKILNWFNNGIINDWYKVKVTRNGLGPGNNFLTVICTANHKFYNPYTGKYKRCDKLEVGDGILGVRNERGLTYAQKQILIGKMLGDGSLCKDSISFSHKKEHEEYVDYTLKSLGDIAGNKQKEVISGYGTQMVRSRTKSSIFIKNTFDYWINPQTNKKIIPSEIINTLSPISLAFWYMDDGSLTHSSEQEDRVSLATCGFDERSIDNLVIALEVLGIDAVKYEAEGYFRIRINSKEADKFFSLIYPYIPKCMQYKLPQYYRGNKNPVDLSLFNNRKFEPLQSLQEVISVEKINPNRINKNRYDIETETHNFVANGILVHNSNFRCGYVPFHADTLWKKIKKFFGRAPKFEFVYGSHNVQLQNKFIYTGYYDKNIYAEIVKKYKLDEILKEGEVIYGEIYGSGIQKNYNYGCKPDEIKFVAFDLFKNDLYVDFSELEKFCKNAGLPLVPVLSRGNFNLEKAKELTKGNSVLCPEQKVREGIVIKPVKDQKCHAGRKILKLISDDYLLQKGNTDFH